MSVGHDFVPEFGLPKLYSMDALTARLHDGYNIFHLNNSLAFFISSGQFSDAAIHDTINYA